MFRVRVQIWLISLIGLAGPLSAQDAEPRTWLDRMSHSFRELNYSGVFTYEFGDEIRAVRIIHAAINGVEHERVMHLDGPEFEVVREGHKLSCIHVGDSLVRLDHTIPAGPFAKKFGAGIGTLDEYYELGYSGFDRVAGHKAVLIDVNPKDGFRYGYQLALDNESALLLRSVMRDAQRRVLERFQFAEVSIGVHLDPKDFLPKSDGTVVAHHLVGEDHPGDQKSDSPLAWRVAWLPRGFMMAASDLPRSPRGTVPTASRMYTDGLAVFSVFVEQNSGESPVNEGSARRGATVAYTVPATGRRDKVVTVVGEVPLNTARRVANSVSFSVVQQ